MLQPMPACRSVCLAVSVFATQAAFAGIITVGEGVGFDYREISDAIVHAQSGDRIVAANGTYAAFDLEANANASNLTLSWGASPGVIGIYGDMQVNTGGQLLFELAGTGNTQAPLFGPVDYDTVLVSGNVRYTGSVILELISGFMPSLGDRFELIATTGNFIWGGTLVAPTLPEGLSWQVSVESSTLQGYNGQSLVATLIPAPGAVALASIAGLVTIRRRR
jgi:hypothetical protein